MIVSYYDRDVTILGSPKKIPKCRAPEWLWWAKHVHLPTYTSVAGPVIQRCYMKWWFTIATTSILNYHRALGIAFYIFNCIAYRVKPHYIANAHAYYVDFIDVWLKTRIRKNDFRCRCKYIKQKTLRQWLWTIPPPPKKKQIGIMMNCTNNTQSLYININMNMHIHITYILYE